MLGEDLLDIGKIREMILNLPGIQRSIGMPSQLHGILVKQHLIGQNLSLPTFLIIFHEVANVMSRLIANKPFGWIALVVKNMLWNCFGKPVLTTALGTFGVVVIAPTAFATMAILWMAARLIYGNMGAVIHAGLSVGSITAGTLASALITLFATTNRFPKVSDNGHFGLRLVHHQHHD